MESPVLRIGFADYDVPLTISMHISSRLEAVQQGSWRIPTTDKVVRSLVRNGENAGCAWNDQTGRQPCAVMPDKETPLWKPQSPIIYLWTAEEANQNEAYYVTYNASVLTSPKYIGLVSQGYRCVHDIPH